MKESIRQGLEPLHVVGLLRPKAEALGYLRGKDRGKGVLSIRRGWGLGGGGMVGGRS